LADLIDYVLPWALKYPDTILLERLIHGQSGTPVPVEQLNLSQ
jgi:hypothetical protein